MSVVDEADAVSRFMEIGRLVKLHREGGDALIDAVLAMSAEEARTTVLVAIAAVDAFTEQAEKK